MHNELLQHPLTQTLKDQLARGWDEFFTLDVDTLIEKGRLGLKWVKTDQPLPVSFQLALNEYAQRKEPSWREIHQKFKSFIPSNALKEQISAGNSILRSASRRGSLKEVDKAFKKWVSETATLIGQMIGNAEAELFAKECQLPSGIHPGTIQALQFCFEKKIDELSQLS